MRIPFDRGVKNTYEELMLISSVYSALRYSATSNNSTIIQPSETILYFEPEIINVKPDESFTIKVNIKNLHEELWDSSRFKV